MVTKEHTERYCVECGKWIKDAPYAMPHDYDTFYLKNSDREALKELIFNDEYRDVQIYDKVTRHNEILKMGKLIHEDYIKKN